MFIDKMFLIQTILVFMMKMFVCLPPPVAPGVAGYYSSLWFSPRLPEANGVPP